MESTKLIELWGPLGAIAWLCGYLIIKAIPSMLDKHTAEQRSSREMFQAELQQEREQRAALLEKQHEMYKEITTENTAALDRLAAAHERVLIAVKRGNDESD
jgi:hypothetical protein